MKVILLKDVKNVGKKDQTEEVSDGYATNFLLPRRLAVQVTKKSVEVLENQQENARIAEENAKIKAQELAKQLEGITLEIAVKTGKEGKLFGNVSLKQVEEEMLKKFNISIDKRKFVDKGPLDMLGLYNLKIELHKGVIGFVKVHIIQGGK